ncbi:MAG: hypothetical protein M1818_002982 [Claussenomyces sp. TS43310]|nr:MAG: hypothetical protein M1818_002982 [Claussenomyces sp. TS43310]
MQMTEYFVYLAYGLLVPVIYSTIHCIYNVFFHPLRAYPGPKSWAASLFPSTVHSLRGRLPYAVKSLHDIYGEVVRTGPNTLSYNSDQAWEDICGHGKRFEKDYDFYGPTVSGAPNIIIAHEADHRRMRRLQSHAFSEKALKAQEIYLQKHVRLFIKGLRKQIDGPDGGVIPIMTWYNFTTFDLIGDLAFADSFHCTEKAELHPWVKITFDFIKMMEYMRLTRVWQLQSLLELFIPKSLQEVRVNHAKWSAEKTQARLKMDTDRQDFMSYMINQIGEKGMSDAELNEAAAILILAGSETVYFFQSRICDLDIDNDLQTATVLSGVTYHLLMHPEIYEKLKTEIRTTFQSAEEIETASLAKLEYLNACLEEGLRMFPPAPTALPRVSPPGGGMVCGNFVPEKTIVGVCSWAANHSAQNFADPDTYTPERWLGDPRFERDHKKASQAFSYGPRNCIGKNLAWAEMRLILANLLWHFDVSLVDSDRDWLERNKIYLLWEKVELNVKLKPRI